MKLSYIQLGDGEKRPVCFSLSAIEDIQDAFGDLDGMRDGIKSGSVKAINTVLEIIIRAGAAYCKGMGIDCPPPLKCRPADLIDATDSSIVSQIFDAMVNDAEREVETQRKN